MFQCNEYNGHLTHLCFVVFPSQYEVIITNGNDSQDLRIKIQIIIVVLEKPDSDI